MRSGLNPTLDEVAEEALVSRAAACRYFRSRLIDAALEPGGFSAASREGLGKALTFFIGTEAILIARTCSGSTRPKAPR